MLLHKHIDLALRVCPSVSLLFETAFPHHLALMATAKPLTRDPWLQASLQMHLNPIIFNNLTVQVVVTRTCLATWQVLLTSLLLFSHLVLEHSIRGSQAPSGAELQQTQQLLDLDLTLQELISISSQSMPFQWSWTMPLPFPILEVMATTPLPKMMAWTAHGALWDPPEGLQVLLLTVLSDLLLVAPLIEDILMEWFQ